MHDPFIIKSKVWKYKGKAAWFFLTIDKKISKEIKSENIYPRRGFGSIKVKVKIGETAWNTSIFPDGNEFLLPIKKSVRLSENLDEGDKVKVILEII